MVADGRGQEVLNSASVITSLLPHIMASVACMASTDTVATVKVGKHLFIYLLFYLFILLSSDWDWAWDWGLGLVTGDGY